MRNYLAELDDEFQDTPTPPTAKTEKSPSCSFCSAQGAPVSETRSPPEPDPLPALYHRWLAGIAEPRALLTLDADQTREAIAAGVVSREVARASVLLLVKVPKGETGPGAAGLLAVPAAKWAGFSVSVAVETLQAWH